MYESPLWQACVCSTHHVNVVKEEATHFRCKKVEQNARYLQAPHGSQTSRTRYSNLCWQMLMLRLLNNKVMSSRISNSTPGLPGLPIPRVYVPTCATKEESFRSDQCIDCNSLFDDAKKKEHPFFSLFHFLKLKQKYLNATTKKISRLSAATASSVIERGTNTSELFANVGLASIL